MTVKVTEEDMVAVGDVVGEYGIGNAERSHQIIAEIRMEAEARGYAAAKAQAAGVARTKYQGHGIELGTTRAFSHERAGVIIATAIEAMEPTDDND